ncbi:hypothetical protein HDZ31DRAFT_67915 [Schizophyllum fasciatum]
MLTLIADDETTGDRSPRHVKHSPSSPITLPSIGIDVAHALCGDAAAHLPVPRHNGLKFAITHGELHIALTDAIDDNDDETHAQWRAHLVHNARLRVASHGLATTTTTLDMPTRTNTHALVTNTLFAAQDVEDEALAITQNAAHQTTGTPRYGLTKTLTSNAANTIRASPTPHTASCVMKRAVSGTLLGSAAMASDKAGATASDVPDAARPVAVAYAHVDTSFGDGDTCGIPLNAAIDADGSNVQKVQLCVLALSTPSSPRHGPSKDRARRPRLAIRPSESVAVCDA